MPIRKDDEVLIVRGKNKGKEGKVVQVSHVCGEAAALGIPLNMVSCSILRSTVRSGLSTSSESPPTSPTAPPSRSVSTPPTLSSPT